MGQFAKLMAEVGLACTKSRCAGKDKAVNLELDETQKGKQDA